MQIKDIFEEIFKGTNYIVDLEEGIEVETFKKNALSNCILDIKKLEKIKIKSNTKDKYFLQNNDIIVSLKEPFKVARVNYISNKKILVPNNYIILRKIKKDYSPTFITYYLDKMGLQELKKEEMDLSIIAIEMVKIPEILYEKQIKLNRLFHFLTERSNYYQTLLDIDEELAKFALEEIIGDNNVK